MARLRPVGHEDQLSIVEHLDELRSRLIVCFAVLFVAFGVCFWQNHALIQALNRALPQSSTAAQNGGLSAVPTQSAKLRAGLEKLEHSLARRGNGAGALAPTPPRSRRGGSGRT